MTQRILVAQLLPGAFPYNDENINPVYRGLVQYEQDQETITDGAYVKSIPPYEVFIEAISALVAISLGLPTPQPALVMSTDDTCPAGHDKDIPLFGTLDGGHQSFRKLVTVGTAVMGGKFWPMYERLQKWKHLPLAALFDEQIANNDRNIGNLLFAGGNEFFLIDHGAAFSGVAACEDETNPNYLVGAIKGSDHKLQKKAADQIKTTHLAKLNTFSIDDLIRHSLHTAYYTDKNNVSSISTFYTNRITHITDIIMNALGAQNQIGLKLV